MIEMNIERRDFLKLSALSAGGFLMSTGSISAMNSKLSSGGDLDSRKIGRQRLGKTGLEISKIAFGGIVVMNQHQKDADAIVARAFENGINYFDVAPSYGDAQDRLGPALQPYRQKCYLACKSAKRDRAGVEEELAGSLKALRTEYFDVYQLHAITDIEKDVHAALRKGGAMEAILEAKEKGLVRNIGFSAHSSAAALAAMREFDFDTIMYPVNFGAHFKSSFDNEVLAEANKRNMGIIAIKAMMKGAWPEGAEKKYPKCWYEPFDDPEMARLALSWTLSQGVSTAVPPGDEKLFKLAMKAAAAIKPLNQDDFHKLKTMASELNPVFPIKS